MRTALGFEETRSIGCELGVSRIRRLLHQPGRVVFELLEIAKRICPTANHRKILEHASSHRVRVHGTSLESIVLTTSSVEIVQIARGFAFVMGDLFDHFFPATTRRDAGPRQ